MDKKQIGNHKEAADRLDLIKDRVFRFVKKNLGKISEYDVNEFIIREFKKEGLATDENYSSQIVAANKNTAFVHYFPKREKSLKIGRDCLILLDIWAKLKRAGAPFADITWMGYTGKKIPVEMKTAFSKVAGARNFAVEFIKKSLGKKQLPNTWEVDRAVRKYFGKMAKYFIHGTGHSLGIAECHGKYFRFGKKSHAQMKTDIPFTIEPGLYFARKFGVRSEINCVITKNSKLETTTKVQKEIIKI